MQIWSKILRPRSKIPIKSKVLSFLGSRLDTLRLDTATHSDWCLEAFCFKRYDWFMSNNVVNRMPPVFCKKLFFGFKKKQKGKYFYVYQYKRSNSRALFWATDHSEIFILRAGFTRVKFWTRRHSKKGKQTQKGNKNIVFSTDLHRYIYDEYDKSNINS